MGHSNVPVVKLLGRCVDHPDRLDIGSRIARAGLLGRCSWCWRTRGGSRSWSDRYIDHLTVNHSVGSCFRCRKSGRTAEPSCLVPMYNRSGRGSWKRVPAGSRGCFGSRHSPTCRVRPIALGAPRRRGEARRRRGPTATFGPPPARVVSVRQRDRRWASFVTNLVTWAALVTNLKPGIH